MPYPISHSSVRALSILLTPELLSKHSHKVTNLSNLQQHNSQDATYNLQLVAFRKYMQSYHMISDAGHVFQGNNNLVIENLVNLSNHKAIFQNNISNF